MTVKKILNYDFWFFSTLDWYSCTQSYNKHLDTITVNLNFYYTKTTIKCKIFGSIIRPEVDGKLWNMYETYIILRFISMKVKSILIRLNFFLN